MKTMTMRIPRPSSVRTDSRGPGYRLDFVAPLCPLSRGGAYFCYRCLRNETQYSPARDSGGVEKA